MSTVSVIGTVVGADGNPAARTVRAYNRATGVLVTEAVSDVATGEYELVLSSGEYQVMALADEGDVYNDLITYVTLP